MFSFMAAGYLVALSVERAKTNLVLLKQNTEKSVSLFSSTQKAMNNALINNPYWWDIDDQNRLTDLAIDAGVLRPSHLVVPSAVLTHGLYDYRNFVICETFCEPFDSNGEFYPSAVANINHVFIDGVALQEKGYKTANQDLNDFATRFTQLFQTYQRLDTLYEICNNKQTIKLVIIFVVAISVEKSFCLVPMVCQEGKLPVMKFKQSSIKNDRLAS